MDHTLQGSDRYVIQCLRDCSYYRDTVNAERDARAFLGAQRRREAGSMKYLPAVLVKY